jgi:hypothetical protein
MMIASALITRGVNLMRYQITQVHPYTGMVRGVAYIDNPKFDEKGKCFLYQLVDGPGEALYFHQVGEAISDIFEQTHHYLFRVEVILD